MALYELDEFQGPSFLGFVRNVPVPQAFMGSTFLPDQPVFDLNFEYIQGVLERPVMASIVSWDSEAPIAGKPALGPKVIGEIPAIKRKARISEKEIIRFLTPRAGVPDAQAAIDHVFDHTRRLLDGVQARVEWLRMQSLSLDKLTYAPDPVDGPTFQFDFGYLDAYQPNFVTGQDGAAVGLPAGHNVDWATVATANPLGDLQYICDKVQSETGFRPARGFWSRRVRGYVLQNAAIRQLVRGPNAPTAILTENELDTVLSLYNLPEMVTYDVQVMEENADGTQTQKRTTPDNVVVLLPPPEATLGATLWGPCAESRGLFGTNLANEAPGVYAVTYAKNDPPSEWIKAIGCAFPSIPGANLVVQATVTT